MRDRDRQPERPHEPVREEPSARHGEAPPPPPSEREIDDLPGRGGSLEKHPM